MSKIKSWKIRLQIKQLFQFILVGSLNAIIDIGSLNVILFIWPTTNDFLLIMFNSFAYLLAVSNSYIWNARFTFRSHAKNDLRERTYFLLQAGISLILSNITFMISVHAFQYFRIPLWLIQNISKALAMAVPSTASFLFMKYFVFRKLKNA